MTDWIEFNVTRQFHPLKEKYFIKLDDIDGIHKTQKGDGESECFILIHKTWIKVDGDYENLKQLVTRQL